MIKPLRQNQLAIKSGGVVGGSVLPPAKREASGLKPFRILCDIADKIVDEFERLEAIRQSLAHRRGGSDDPPPDVKAAELGRKTESDIARCRVLLEELDPEDFYEEDSEGDRVLKRAVVAKRLAGVFANARGWSGDDAAATARMVVEHVVDAEPDYFVLEGACREIEATHTSQKGVLVTADVLEKIGEHRERWVKRWNAIETIEIMSRELQIKIRDAHANFEREKADADIGRAEQNLQNQHRLLNVAKQQEVAKQEASKRLQEKLQEAEKLQEKLQEALRKSSEETEAAVVRLAKCEEEVDAASEALVAAIEARNKLDDI